MSMKTKKTNTQNAVEQARARCDEIARRRRWISVRLGISNPQKPDDPAPLDHDRNLDAKARGAERTQLEQEFRASERDEKDALTALWAAEAEAARVAVPGLLADGEALARELESAAAAFWTLAERWFSTRQAYTHAAGAAGEADHLGHRFPMPRDHARLLLNAFLEKLGLTIG